MWEMVITIEKLEPFGWGVHEGLRRGLRVEGGGIKGKRGDIRVDGSGYINMG